jgi:SagB-type dehydrogenase family enzyme
MEDLQWSQTAIPQQTDELLWEIFHENSKTSKYGDPLSNDAVVEEMNNMHEVLPYNYVTAIKLPDTFADFTKDFEATILTRKTARKVEPCAISLVQLRTLLHFAYGETRSNADEGYYSRSFRTVPSGGALYPLELYFFSNGHIESLPAGLYHYSPSANAVELIRAGDLREEIRLGLVSFQANLADDLSLLIFLGAFFNRSVFKYKDKGYRFVLLEAGHVAQNIGLTANAMGFGHINMGGYHDRIIDEFLDFDGINQSTVYMNGIGRLIH